MKYIDINSKSFEKLSKSELLLLLKKMGLLNEYPWLKDKNKSYLIMTIRKNF